MKITTIVGARPQFIKAAVVSNAIIEHNQNSSDKIAEEIIHTGQHYDKSMSSDFFRELSIPEPSINLRLGGGHHGAMTGEMLKQIEKRIMKTLPDIVLVYGDTNSTLAGALAASKLNIRVAHIEAGLRSFNKTMPEEINRILTDHISSFLFCPTTTSIKNLAAEGITKGVHHVGDVMYDTTKTFTRIAENKSNILSLLGLTPKSYLLATVHRAENTDSKENLSQIVDALNELSQMYTIVIPLHPRTRKALSNQKLSLQPRIKIIEPTPFFDTLVLSKNALALLTDSGGMQKEAYFHRTPCVTLRNETEWVETVAAGWNILAGAKKTEILKALSTETKKAQIDEYGSGESSRHIIKKLFL